MEEAVSYIGYAVSQAKTGRYSVETRQLLYAESLMRMNHTSIGPVYPNRIQGRNRYRDHLHLAQRHIHLYLREADTQIFQAFVCGGDGGISYFTAGIPKI